MTHPLILPFSVLLLTLCLNVSQAAVQRDAQSVRVSTPALTLACDLKTGRWQAQWPNGGKIRPAIHGADCAVEIADGFDQRDVTRLAASESSSHVCAASDITPIKDAFGSGTQIVIHHRTAGRPELRQIFRVYPAQSYFFVRLEVHSPRPLSTRDISPVLIDGARTTAGLELGSGGKPRTLFVPYDNDAWVRYNSDTTSGSYEVTAVYDNAARHGFVVGSVTHDLWKTGLSMSGAGPHALANLRVYGGAAGALTRDSQPHGLISGKVLISPQIFVGYFPDWRDGLEAFGRANARLHPPLAWGGGVPFGWNSWAAYMDKVNSAGYLAAADFLHSKLQPKGFDGADGTVFVNFDSFWDNLSEAQLEDAVRHVHAQGQKAGIYWTPFVCWGGDLKRPVEGTNGRYTYQDILLKDAAGKPLPTLDGGMPIDPTHPGALARIDAQLAKFVRQGFDFVKLDFVTHGALEGAHFDPRVTTGTAAYNLGMARIAADLAPAKVGRPFFISLSIAPLFPAGYGHSRRISCDAFGGIDQTEYMLNSLTYGWWEGGSLYHFNDPDHTVLYQAHGQQKTTEAEGRSRLTASAITGTVLLESDDLTDPAAQARAALLLTNPRVNALARTGRPFRPVEGDTGTTAADTFVRADPDGKFYVAVFNFSKSQTASKHLSLARLGLKPAVTYRVENLWDGSIGHVQTTLSADLAPAECRLLCLTRE